MTNEEFIESRRSGIGGTDAAAICRANPYKCPVKVYLDKIGESKSEDENMFMWMGKALEPNLKDKYEEVYKCTVQTPGMIKHHTYDFLMANVDGIVEGSHIVEFKTSCSADKWGEERSGEALMSDVPLEYYYQIQHYMMVTGMDEAHIYVFIHGFKMETRLYKFKRNPLFIAKMRCKLMDFWINNVQKNVPPRALTRDEVALLHPEPKSKKKIDASEEDIKTLNELAKIKSDMDKLKKIQKVGRDHLASSIQDGEELVFDGSVIASFRCNKNGTRTLRTNI